MTRKKNRTNENSIKLNKSIKEMTDKALSEVRNNNRLNISTLSSVRDLYIMYIWHNVINSSPTLVEDCRKMRDLPSIPCFDGIMIKDTLTYDKAQEFFHDIKPFLYDNDLDMLHQNHYQFKLDNSLIWLNSDLITGLDDRTRYRSSIIGTENKQEYTFAKGVQYKLMQSVRLYFHYNIDDNTYTIRLWTNPNKYVRQGTIQQYEPMLWFIKECIYPYLPNRVIEQLHSNIDLGINYNNIIVTKYRKRVTSRFNGTTYMNNIIRQKDSNTSNVNNVNDPKKISDTLVMYDKYTERCNSTNSYSYVHRDEIKALRDKGIYFTRLELRSNSVLQSYRMLKNKTLLNTKYQINYKFKDNGKTKTKAVKDCLNATYKQLRTVLNDFILIDETIMQNMEQAVNSLQAKK